MNARRSSYTALDAVARQIVLSAHTIAAQTFRATRPTLHIQTTDIGPRNERDEPALAPVMWPKQTALPVAEPNMEGPVTVIEFTDDDDIKLEAVVKALIHPPARKEGGVVLIPKGMIANVVEAVRAYLVRTTSQGASIPLQHRV